MSNICGPVDTVAPGSWRTWRAPEHRISEAWRTSRWRKVALAGSVAALGLTIAGFAVGWSLLFATPAALAIGAGAGAGLGVIFALSAPGRRSKEVIGAGVLLLALDVAVLVGLASWRPGQAAGTGSALGFIGIIVSAVFVIAVLLLSTIGRLDSSPRAEAIVSIALVFACLSVLALPGWSAEHQLRVAWTTTFAGEADDFDYLVVAGPATVVVGHDDIKAYDTATGRELWQRDRASGPSYYDPAVQNAGAALLVTDAEGEHIVDPATGRNVSDLSKSVGQYVGTSGTTVLMLESTATKTTIYGYSMTTGELLWQHPTADACPPGLTPVTGAGDDTSIAAAGGMVAVAYSCASSAGQVADWADEVSLIHPADQQTDRTIDLPNAPVSGPSVTEARSDLSTPDLLAVGSTIVAVYDTDDLDHLGRAGIATVNGDLRWTTTTPDGQIRDDQDPVPQSVVSNERFNGWLGNGWGTISAATGRAVSTYPSYLGHPSFDGLAATDLALSGARFPLDVRSFAFALVDDGDGRPVAVDRIPADTDVHSTLVGLAGDTLLLIEPAGSSTRLIALR